MKKQSRGNRSRRLKKAAVLLVIAFALAWVMELLQLATMPKMYEYSFPEGVDLGDPYSRISGIYRYNWADKELTATDADPQLYFYTGDMEKLQSAFFLFKRPTEEDVSIQLFYPEEPGYYSESASIKTVCPAGTTFFYIPIPAGQYDQIRLDLDAAVPIPLEAVYFSEQEPQKTALPEGPHLIRVLVMTVIWFGVLCFMAWCHTWQRIRRTLKDAREGLKAGKKTAVWYLLLFPAMIGACIGLAALFLPLTAGKSLNSATAVFFGLVGLNLAALLTFRKTLRTQPEYHFLLLCLSIGFLFCYYIPHTGLNSWDEETHYNVALITSYVDEWRVTPQDDLPIFLNGSEAFDLNGGIDAIHDRQDSLYRAGASATGTPSLDFAAVPEAFNGLGLYLGRVLGLRYYQMLVLGRFTGLLAYALAGFFAIRKLKSGKMIAAAVMLIPTSMFLTGSYNYDIYVTGFTLLGLSYCMAQWQRREEKLSALDAVIMIGAIAFGCLAKMVYFPLLWIPAFLPRDKFRSKKEHRLFLAALAAATAVLFFSYVGPRLFAGGTAVVSDSRGGSDVDSGGQIAWILANPMEYARILLQFLRDNWLNLRNCVHLLTNIAYYGFAGHEFLYLMLLAVVAFTDRNEYDKGLAHRPLAHAAALLLCFGALALAATSMYIVFTPVGYETINGAQYRYMMPVIYPVLAYIGSGLVDNRMDRAWYNGLVLSVAGYVGFAAVFTGFIIKYF